MVNFYAFPVWNSCGADRVGAGAAKPSPSPTPNPRPIPRRSVEIIMETALDVLSRAATMVQNNPSGKWTNRSDPDLQTNKKTPTGAINQFRLKRVDNFYDFNLANNMPWCTQPKRGSGGGGYTQLFYGFHLWAKKTRKVFQQCVRHRKKCPVIWTSCV